MSIKMRIRYGRFVVAYEGSEEFAANNLMELVSQFADLLPDPVVDESSSSNSSPAALPQGKAEPNPITDYSAGKSQDTIQLSVNNVAAKLGHQKGPELALSVCAFLAIVERRETFSRADILKAIKTATSYYKESYSKNLSSILTRLVKQGNILERSNGVYALPASVRLQFESMLRD
ncbi:MAG: hypothetical protein KC519_14995 [Anaerolineae bacterium]|nr:hypothetical protein [Anaerolineae bacterium]